MQGCIEQSMKAFDRKAGVQIHTAPKGPLGLGPIPGLKVQITQNQPTRCVFGVTIAECLDFGNGQIVTAFVDRFQGFVEFEINLSGIGVHREGLRCLISGWGGLGKGPRSQQSPSQCKGLKESQGICGFGGTRSNPDFPEQNEPKGGLCFLSCSIPVEQKAGNRG